MIVLALVLLGGWLGLKSAGFIAWMFKAMLALAAVAVMLTWKLLDYSAAGVVYAVRYIRTRTGSTTRGSNR